ncbi:hypothetical protein [Streptomyces broussonetiae]|uniref:MBL fold metallo-hydrolase n=1 Tax=Streptomyces broussonetiae TaxID=2686304 RepID=A0A6I6MVD3_9ACTN|nr:hypothetical protein [Streptomyces broussonetiae]QHA03382.1 hypothetical protein GQF42_08970 [Streptomyces broussonetiae]
MTQVVQADRRGADVSWAWLHDRTDWGYSNSGLVASEGQTLLVDTQFTLHATEGLLTAVEPVCLREEIGLLVCTHQNGDHT